MRIQEMQPTYQTRKYVKTDQRFIQFFDVMIQVFLWLLVVDVGLYIVSRFGGDFLLLHFMIHMAMIPIVFILIELCFFEACCNASRFDDDDDEENKEDDRKKL